MFFSRNRKTCAPGLHDPKPGLREGVRATAERLFNIVPNYGDKTGSAEQCQTVAVVL